MKIENENKNNTLGNQKDNRADTVELPSVKDISIGEDIDMQTGFQATNILKAIEIIKKMKENHATVVLAFTANMIATGLRGIIRDLVKEKFVDLIITTGGSLDHDFIRCSEKYYIGNFNYNDKQLHKLGINRIGNILVPNKAYISFEKKIKPVLEEAYSKKKIITPSGLARTMGGHACEDSFLYWAYKNNIPVYSPGITDSALGMQMYFFKQQHKDFGVDVTGDMDQLAQSMLTADKTGAIVIGGGISKHHTIGVNILRDGLDYAVYITTASEWDGSLSGAKTQEAISWGKIREEANHITVYGEATTIFPTMMRIYNQDTKREK